MKLQEYEKESQEGLMQKKVKQWEKEKYHLQDVDNHLKMMGKRKYEKEG